MASRGLHWYVVPLAVLAVGCAAVGPDYRAPSAAALPTAYTATTAPQQPSADDAAIARFWDGFADPLLSDLVRRALSANGDVRLASARLIEARALLLGTQADALPSFDVAAGASRSVAPSYQQPGASRSQRTGNVVTLSGLMNWELDLFGRQRRAVESASATLDAADFGIGSAQAAVSAAVATNYLQLRGLQQRLEWVERSLDSQRESLRLTEARAAVGRASDFDLERLQSQVASTAAGLPLLSEQAGRAIQRLAVLTATPPAELVRVLSPRQPVPQLPVTDLAALPVGAPEALLRRRPDIRAAERQLAAANADIGVAQADRFPRLSLSGLLGLNSNRASALDDGAGVWSLGASLSWAAWDFGRLRANVQAAEARHVASLVGYEQTVLIALEETETALDAFTLRAQHTRELARASRSAEAAAQIARVRFEAGSVDLLAVLDAERTALGTREQHAAAVTDTATGLVEVYRALGGGWPRAEPAARRLPPAAGHLTGSTTEPLTPKDPS
jgi:outer membrane protein, multidrug efflux system